MWIFWKLYTWIILRQWNYHLTECQERYKDDSMITPTAMADIISRIPWTVMNAIPMDSYHYHPVVTASVTIQDMELWLRELRGVLQRYNELTPEMLAEDRPADTYIDSIIYNRIEMTDPMEQPLDKFMMVNGKSVNAVYLNVIFTLVKEISLQVEKIEDAIDKRYFIRKTAPFLDDLYAVLTVLIAAGTLHGK